MIRIIHQRSKCIGCNGCQEVAKDRWKVSKKDGKSVLRGSNSRNGYFNVVVGDDEYEANITAANNCPVKIIQVKRV